MYACTKWETLLRLMRFPCYWLIPKGFLLLLFGNIFFAVGSFPSPPVYFSVHASNFQCEDTILGSRRLCAPIVLLSEGGTIFGKNGESLSCKLFAMSKSNNGRVMVGKKLEKKCVSPFPAPEKLGARKKNENNVKKKSRRPGMFSCESREALTCVTTKLILTKKDPILPRVTHSTFNALFTDNVFRLLRNVQYLSPIIKTRGKERAA